MAKPMSIDQFMNAQTSAPRGSFLDKAKDWPVVAGSKPPLRGVNVVLHKKDSIYQIWRHGMPRILITDKDDKKTIKVIPGNYVCHEDEKVCIAQYKRDDDGQRRLPPKKCGLCKMVEWFYQKVAIDEEMDWLEQVFEFTGDDRRNNRILHAGGICNQFSRKDLTDDDKQELKDHGIYGDEAWMENCYVKPSYLFLVADYDHPENGIQIAMEPAALGDSTQTLISDRRASKGMDEGNPSINPFVIQWTYNEDKRIAFGKKYHARPMEKLPITDEILELIEGDLPDVENMTTAFDQTLLRVALEEAFVGKFEMPWDEFFGKPRAAADQQKSEQSSRSHEREEREEKREERRETRPPARESKKTDPSPPPESDEEELECENCDGVVYDSTKVCPHCHFDFEQGKVVEPEPPPRRKKASGSSQETKAGASKPPPPKAAEKGTKKPRGAFPDDDDPDGDLPF